MSIRGSYLRQRRGAISDLYGRMKIGTRLYCPRTNRYYQLGCPAPYRMVWMMDESESKKGVVDPRTVLKEFEVVTGAR